MSPDDFEECGTPLGYRLVPNGKSAAEGSIWRREPYSCGKPGKVRGEDGRFRCVQHDRMSRGLPGKWVGAA